MRDAIFIMERMELLRQALERYPETAGLVEEYFQPEDTFANVRSTVANWMRRYRPIAACWHRLTRSLETEVSMTRPKQGIRTTRIRYTFSMVPR
jgi:hypothetical protein